MRISDTANHHFQMSIAGKKGKLEETDKQHKHGNKPVELRIKDTLELSGRKGQKLQTGADKLEHVNLGVDIPKPAVVNGKYYLSEMEKPELGTADISQMVVGDLMPWQVDPNESYERYGNSNLLNIDRANRRESYYELMFNVSTDKANEIFGPSYSYNGRDAYTVDLSVARYEELREQVMNTFGDDKELLNANLESLDNAFSRHLGQIAKSHSISLYFDQSTAEYAKNTDSEPTWELNKLATHKDFDRYKFHDNAKNLMQQFAQEFIGQIKSGTNYASAWDNAMGTMSRSTTTTSVNNLSFSDFMILDGTPWRNATTKADVIASHTSHNNSFNNNPNLSKELLAILEAA